MTTHNARRRELQDLARSATPAPPKVSDGGRLAASADSSGYVDLSALAALDPNWAERPLDEIASKAPSLSPAPAAPSSPLSAPPVVVAAPPPAPPGSALRADLPDLNSPTDASRGFKFARPLLAASMLLVVGAGGLSAFLLRRGELHHLPPAAEIAPATPPVLAAAPPPAPAPPAAEQPQAERTPTPAPAPVPVALTPAAVTPVRSVEAPARPVRSAPRAPARPAAKPVAKKPAAEGSSLDDMIRRAVKTPTK